MSEISQWSKFTNCLKKCWSKEVRVLKKKATVARHITRPWKTKHSNRNSDGRRKSRKPKHRLQPFKEHRKASQTQLHDFFGDLHKEINRPSTKIRDFKADFLMYCILDKCIDEIMPIVSAYDSRLSYFQVQMRKLKHNFPAYHQDEISSLKLELGDLLRTLRPLTRAIRHVIEEEQFATDCNTYLEDVQDHIEHALDDVRALIDLCNTLNQDMVSFADQKMNRTLYILTMATTIFIPVQFITGLYGMNFETMPELEWEFGYAYFWILVFATMLFISLMFKWLGLF